MYITSVKSNNAVFAMHGDPIAISVGIRGGDDGLASAQIREGRFASRLFDLACFIRAGARNSCAGMRSRRSVRNTDILA